MPPVRVLVALEKFVRSLAPAAPTAKRLPVPTFSVPLLVKFPAVVNFRGGGQSECCASFVVSKSGQRVGGVGGVFDQGLCSGESDAGVVVDDIRAGEFERAGYVIGAAGKRCAAKVGQGVGREHDEFAAGAHIQRSVNGEVACCSKRLSDDVERATGSDGVQIRQSVCAAHRVLDLRRRAGKRDVGRVSGDRGAIKLEYSVHDISAARQSASAAVEVQELVRSVVNVQSSSGDGFDRALIVESGAARINFRVAGLVRDGLDCSGVDQADHAIADVSRPFNRVSVMKSIARRCAGDDAFRRYLPG